MLHTIVEKIVFSDAELQHYMRFAVEASPEGGRVLVESGGCSGFQYGMSFDEPKPDDSHLESEGVQLIIDPASLAYCTLGGNVANRKIASSWPRLASSRRNAAASLTAPSCSSLVASEGPGPCTCGMPLKQAK